MKERVFSAVLLLVLAVGTAGLVALSIATIAAEPANVGGSATKACSEPASQPAASPCHKTARLNEK